jgi:O-antigen/teichoic acid export membrane protein
MERAKSADINFWWETFHSAHSHLAAVLLKIVFVVVLSRFLSIEEVGLYFFYLAVAYVLFQPVKGVGAAVRKRVSSINTGREKYLVGSIALIVPILVVSLSGTVIIAVLAESYIPFRITFLGTLGLIICVVGDGTRSLGYQYLSGCGEPAKASQLRNYASNTLRLIGSVFVL